MHRSTGLRGVTLLLTALLALAGCGGDGADVPDEGAADEEVVDGTAGDDDEGDAAGGESSDEDQDSEDAGGTAEDPTGAAGSADVVLSSGQTFTASADDCSVTSEGGQSTVTFAGTDDAGTGVQVDHEGNGTTTVSITTADGATYELADDARPDVVSDGAAATASVNGKIVAADGAEVDYFVTIACG